MTHPTPQSGNQNRPASTRGILFASVAGVALVAAASTIGVTQFAAAQAQTVAVPAAGTAAQAAPGSFGPTFADLIAQVEPAVVSIRVTLAAQTASLNTNNGRNALPSPFGGPGQGGLGGQGQGGQGQGGLGGAGPQGGNRGGGTAMAEGAGFFISADGYLVTANHVVDGAKTMQVLMDDGTTYPAKIIGTDQATDVALLKVDAAGKTFTFVKFADQMPRVGDWVVAIGNPYGLGETATAGIVSALARDIGDRTYDGYLQIDAPINEGNSGGPTFDVHGNVVGINDAIFTPSGGSVGIGFDVPADTAKSVVAQLQQSGKVVRGWLGVQVQDVTQDLADGLGIKSATGALVSDPEAGSPATKAGIAAGDVIVAVNGTTVKDSRGLAQSIAGLAPGTSVKLDVLHGTASRSVNVTLGTLPPPTP